MTCGMTFPSFNVVTFRCDESKSNRRPCDKFHCAFDAVMSQTATPAAPNTTTALAACAQANQDRAKSEAPDERAAAAPELRRR